MAREIISLTKRIDDILWELVEDLEKKTKRSPEELDAMVDECRNKLIPPFSSYLRRHLQVPLIPNSDK